MSEKELMKVVGFYEGLPIDDPKSFIDEKEQNEHCMDAPT